MRSIYEAVNRRDWDSAYRDLTADIELTTPPGINAGTSRGREEGQGFWEEMLGAFEEWTVEPEELLESGDQVVAVVGFRARPRGSSAEIENRTGQLWTFHDVNAQSMRMFPEPEKALGAAGLPGYSGSMSKGNVEAWKRGVEALLAELDPEVEWHSAILMGLGGEATGRHQAGPLSLVLEAQLLRSTPTKWPRRGLHSSWMQTRVLPPRSGSGLRRWVLTTASIAGVLVLLGPAQRALAQDPLVNFVDFAGPTNFNTGAGHVPHSLAVGDFNADSDPDLAVANWMSGTVAILVGGAGGSFAAPAPFAVGFGPESVAVGDFNADSDPDLAVANGSTDNVSVVLGGAGASFGAVTNFPVGDFPTSVAVGNFDADPDPDLAVANQGTDNVSVLLGGAGGTFGAATDFAAGDGPHSVAVGDFDGDNDPDLAVANTQAGDVSVLLGGAGGSFGAAPDLSGVGTPIAVAVGDFNADSDPDLAVASGDFSASVSVLLGGVGGSFGAPAQFATGATTIPAAVAVGDFNQDSDPDLAVANDSTGGPNGSVSVLLGGGGGSFVAPRNFAAAADSHAVAVGDFNADSAPDLAVGNAGSGNVSVLVNKPVDRTTPPSAALAMSPSPALNTQTVSFDASASTELPGRTITHYEWDLDGDGSFETDTGQVPTASRSYATPIEITPGVRITNQLGLFDEERRPLSIRLTPPPGAVGASINAGDIATNDPNVTLSLVWPPLTSDALISNDGGFGPVGSTAAFPVGAQIPWLLASSGPERLPKIVYVRFLGAGANDLTHTDDIILDENPPGVTGAELAGGSAAPGKAGVPSRAVKRYRVHLGARDDNSGVSLAEFAKRKRGERTTVRFTPEDERGKRRLDRVVRVRSRSTPRFVRVRDAGGNYSRWRKIEAG